MGGSKIQTNTPGPQRPICDGCGRPMPLTDDERMALQRREFEEFEDVVYPNGKGRKATRSGRPSDG